MFLPLIILLHAGLSICEMSMMGMTQIGAQVIIIRSNTKRIKRKYYKLKKESKIMMALGYMLLIDLYSRGIQNKRLINLYGCFLSFYVMKHKMHFKTYLGFTS